jgi:hypothetical protein
MPCFSSQSYAEVSKWRQHQIKDESGASTAQSETGKNRMRSKIDKKWFLPLVVALALIIAPWPVAYGHHKVMAGEEAIQIEVAEPSAALTWTAFGGMISRINTPGDLFYIDATNNPDNIRVTLYITNTPELGCCYRYLTLEVGVYIETGPGQWEKVSGGSGGTSSDAFITLVNGTLGFTLSGKAKYKITIDGGYFYCIGIDGGSVSPKFRLTVA